MQQCPESLAFRSARQSALARAVRQNGNRLSNTSLGGTHSKELNDEEIKCISEPRLPTCAVIAHQNNPQYKLLSWALQAGADLLPPSEVMEMRSNVLENPRSTLAIHQLGKECEKNSKALERIFMAHLCVNCDENVPSSQKKCTPSKNVDDSLPRFVLISGCERATTTTNYNKFQRARTAEIRQHTANQVDEKHPNWQCLGQNQEEVTVKDFSSQIYDDSAKESSSRSLKLCLEQRRSALQAAEVALIRINKYIEQGPGYILPLYRHNRSTVNHDTKTSTGVAPHTRSSILRSIVSKNNGVRKNNGLHRHQTCFDPRQSVFSSSLGSLSSVDGCYQMPNVASLHQERKRYVQFIKLNKLFNKLQQLESETPTGDTESLEMDENADAESELDDDHDGEGENDGPLIDVQFNPEFGTLNVKFRLSESQLLNLRSQISVPKTCNSEGIEEEVDLALSNSTFLFQSEFVGIAEDVWLGTKGPWRGKVLHILRKTRRPDGTAEIREPPYLHILSRIIDGGHKNEHSDPAIMRKTLPGDEIDSIVVGRWCFARMEPQFGAKPSDPYQCIGCGNIRNARNVAYAASTASGMRRGKYFCPFCRRATIHVNMLLGSNSSKPSTQIV